ncbi:hypothetical protein ACLOJK_018736 [Asimina triloba]
MMIRLVSIGNLGAAVTLLLSTSLEGSHFYPNALRAVELSSVVLRSLHELAVKVVVANMVPFEENGNLISLASYDRSNKEVPLMSMLNILEKKHILLFHARADSERVPWANPMGKAFLPLPFLIEDDPDGPVPTTF